MGNLCAALTLTGLIIAAGTWLLGYVQIRDTAVLITALLTLMLGVIAVKERSEQ